MDDKVIVICIFVGQKTLKCYHCPCAFEISESEKLKNNLETHPVSVSTKFVTTVSKGNNALKNPSLGVDLFLCILSNKLQRYRLSMV